MRAGNGTDVRCKTCGGNVRDRGSRLDMESGEIVEIYQCIAQPQKMCCAVIYVRVR